MALHQFFLDTQVLAQETEAVFALDLSAEDAHHAKVLRLSPGEHIAVVDGSQDYFECEIVALQPELLVKICGHDTRPSSLVKLTLVQGLAKGDKMETVVRQGTELGVHRFIPFAAQRSVLRLDARKAPDRIRRWQAVAKSAAMQSGCHEIPEVTLPHSLSALETELSSFDRVVVFWEEAQAEDTIKRALTPLKGMLDQGEPCSVAVIVGPEGGLSNEEVTRLLNIGPQCTQASLGSNILRTETAGVIAPSLVLYELGELGGTL